MCLVVPRGNTIEEHGHAGCGTLRTSGDPGTISRCSNEAGFQAYQEHLHEAHDVSSVSWWSGTEAAGLYCGAERRSGVAGRFAVAGQFAIAEYCGIYAGYTGQTIRNLKARIAAFLQALGEKGWWGRRECFDQVPLVTRNVDQYRNAAEELVRC